MEISVNSDKPVGILGGGQLARMLGERALLLGVPIQVLAESEDEPACEIASKVLLAKLDDPKALETMAEECQILVLENEFIESSVLQKILTKSNTAVIPNLAIYEKLDSKLKEKQAFSSLGIPCAEYQKVSNPEEIKAFASQWGYPLMLKASRGGYDGYGNALIKDESGIDEAIKKLGDAELMIERGIKIKKELAVQVISDGKNAFAYPVCETVQSEDHICTHVVAPAEIKAELAQEISDYALKAIKGLEGIGLFAIEFFLDEENKIYLNESAPRPHNSLHYSQEGCYRDQFENLLRVALGLPIGSTELKFQAAGMLNILGTQNGPARLETPIELWDEDQSQLHIYGKKLSRVGRKMAHLNFWGTRIEVEDKIKKYMGRIKI